MIDIYHKYIVTAKDKKGSCAASLSKKDNEKEDVAQLMLAINEQVKRKLEDSGLRDMQIIFTEEDYESIRSIMNYPLDKGSGMGTASIEINLSYKSIYFKTKGRVLIDITKSIEKDISVHHRPVLGMFMSKKH